MPESPIPGRAYARPLSPIEGGVRPEEPDTCNIVMLTMLGMSAFRWLGATCLLACAACGDNEPLGPEPETDDGAFDPIEFRALAASAVCEPLARCCALTWDAFGGEEGCIALFIVASFESLSELGRSIEAGRVGYDERRLRECREDSEDVSCDDVRINRTPESCDDYLFPLVPLGGFCTIDYDCVDGFCSDSECVADFADDEPCDEDSQCASVYCSEDEVCRPWEEREALLCL